MTHSQIYDVAVIGGGLAGAAAAARVSQKGAKVVILEKEAKLHHKVCGEFISYEAHDYLARLDIDLVGLGATVIDRLRLVAKDKSVMAPLGFQAASLSRFRLDEAVLNSAGNAGAEIRSGTHVTGMQREGTHWILSCQNDQMVLAQSVFLATGKHDLRGWSQRTGKQNDYIGFKIHFSLKPAAYAALHRTVVIALYPGGYAGLEPIEDGMANLCLVVTKDQFAAAEKNWENLLANIVRATPDLGAYLENATACWDRPLAIYGIPYGFVYAPPAQAATNLFRLGDQMAVIPSVCGDGMSIALHTGFLAADHFLKSDAHTYHSVARKQLRAQIARAVWLARALSTRHLQNLIVPLCNLMPALISNGITSTRLARAYVS